VRVRAVCLVGWFAGGMLSVPAPVGAVSFSFATIAGDMLTGAQSEAFATAAMAWSAVLTYPIQVAVNIGFRDLGTSIRSVLDLFRYSASGAVMLAGLGALAFWKRRDASERMV
jgi:hypothetical protein